MLARGLALNRISFGLGLVLAPSLYGRVWIGRRAARREPARVFARALGARDLALGAGALLTFDDPEAARRWFAAHAVADATDFLATLASGARIPAGPRLFTLSVAAASTAIAAAYAAAPDG